MRSLYRAAARDGGESVLAVRTVAGRVFGAFAAEPWKVHHRYHGTGESFVFVKRNKRAASDGVVSRGAVVSEPGDEPGVGVDAEGGRRRAERDEKRAEEGRDEEAERGDGDASSVTGDEIRAYRWSQRNDYFQFGRADGLACGGGGGFALWLDEELLRGNSGACETFDSPCLSGEETEFEVAYVELWTFAPG